MLNAQAVRTGVEQDRRPLELLFVSLSLPYPPNNGQRIRNLGLLRALAAEGYRITLISFGTPEEEWAGYNLQSLCDQIKLVPLPNGRGGKLRQLWDRGRGLFSAVPYGAIRFRSAQMTAAIQQALAQRQFDGLICDDIYILGNLPQVLNVPIFLNKHDITHEIMQRFLYYQQNPLMRLYGAIERANVRRLEANACSFATHVFGCSQRDRSLLKELSPRATISVMPNVIDVSSYTPTCADDGLTVLYVGAMDWYPNQDAVKYFTFQILPRLRQLVSGVRFVVAGRGVSGDFRRQFCGVADVAILGEVPNVRTEIAKATVCVVPLRIASGTRLKILEAGAMQRAVVSTSVGAEGLELVNGKEFILADTPEEFAESVAALLRDPGRRQAIGRAARLKIEKQYHLTNLQTAVRTVFSASAADAFKTPARRPL